MSDVGKTPRHNEEVRIEIESEVYYGIRYEVKGDDLLLKIGKSGPVVISKKYLPGLTRELKDIYDVYWGDI